MSSITNSLTSIIPPAQQSPTPSVQTQTAKTPTAFNTFGDAVSVNLSPPAQASVASQSTPSTPIAVQPSNPSVAQLVSAAKQKAAPLVGLSGASDVVDNKGSISKVQLAIEIAEQAQKK